MKFSEALVEMEKGKIIQDMTEDLFYQVRNGKIETAGDLNINEPWSDSVNTISEFMERKWKLYVEPKPIPEVPKYLGYFAESDEKDWGIVFRYDAEEGVYHVSGSNIYYEESDLVHAFTLFDPVTREVAIP